MLAVRECRFEGRRRLRAKCGLQLFTTSSEDNPQRISQLTNVVVEFKALDRVRDFRISRQDEILEIALFRLRELASLREDGHQKQGLRNLRAEEPCALE